VRRAVLRLAHHRALRVGQGARGLAVTSGELDLATLVWTARPPLPALDAGVAVALSAIKAGGGAVLAADERGASSGRIGATAKQRINKSRRERRERR
jgi:hypothetical protein